MAIFAGATGVKIPPAGQPVVDPTLFGKNDPSAGTFTKYWYDFLLAMAKAVAATTVSFSAHKNSFNQTLSTAPADVKVTFGTEAWDIGGVYDAANSRWFPPAGLVQLIAYVLLTPTNAIDGTQHHISLYKNGSLLKVGNVIPYAFTSGPAASANITPGVVAIDQANGTDFYEVFIAVSSVASGSRTIAGTPQFTFFQGTVL